VNSKISSLVVLSLLSLSSIGLMFFPLSITQVSAQSQGFEVINAQWGTTSNPLSAAPGDHNVPLTVTLEYVFPNTGESAQGFLELPSGFSLYNGSTTAFASTTGTMPTGSTFELTFQDLYISSDAALGSYVMPVNMTWTAAGYSYVLNETVDLTVYLEGRPQLYFHLDTPSLTPAEVNYVPVVVSNNGSGTASNIFVTASSQQAGILNSLSEITSLPAGSMTSPTLEVYVPIASAGDVVSITVSASYTDPYGNNRTTTESLATFVSTAGQASVKFSSNLVTLTSGATNNVTITLLNAGTLNLAQVSTTISTQSQAVSVLGTFPNVQSLATGASTTAVIEVFVGASASDSPVSLTFSTTYVEPDGTSGSASQSLGFYTTTYESPVANFSANVIPIKTSLNVGEQGNVSFQVINSGSTTVYSPSLSITASSPLVVVANSTYSNPMLTIVPGGSVTYEATLDSSPSSTPGSYSGEITVSFADDQGDRYNKTFSVGFTLTGTVEIIVQDATVSQGTSNLTVSGTLLNEGTASAYYASIAGHTSAASSKSGSTSSRGNNIGASTYIGEIDPNTPVPFSTTVPYTPTENSTKATVELVISYLNNFGTNSTITLGIPTTLLSISSLLVSSDGSTSPTASSGGQTLVTIVFYVIIAIVVVAAVAGAVLVRRMRRQQRIAEGTEPSEDSSKVV
jgi:hypothetical protein